MWVILPAMVCRRLCPRRYWVAERPDSFGISNHTGNGADTSSNEFVHAADQVAAAGDESEIQSYQAATEIQQIDPTVVA